MVLEMVEEEKEGGARRMLTLEQVLKLVPVGHSTLKRMMAREQFPRPHYISPNKRVWYEDQIERWQRTLPAESVRKKQERRRNKGGRLA
ncbi:AlpA family phage regulatory protein [Bradyrhizobium sp. 170]|uniref:helix-turn-helix transcriptional regulator n=1 Tax=Bradyrhizobium sp. 170 TaxID=2782641 RepID=UPI001FFF6D44|nr:AlpA family phage regulatory protein [Bradyrhizobium sp. 170]UPK03158.1 AlpA family phage regulatory protein [Bradyrhizobium sp. 170]